MNDISQFLQIGLISLLGVMSPGPDFAMVSRNSLVFSRRTGLASALGLGTGILFHVALSLTGIAFFLTKSPATFTLLKGAGALYLIWIGIQSLRAGKASAPTASGSAASLTVWQAYKTGLLTNMLNPKATLFIFSIYSQMVGPTSPLLIRVLLGAEIAIITCLWFSVVATLLSQKRVRAVVQVVQSQINLVMGCVLVSWGVYLIALGDK